MIVCKNSIAKYCPASRSEVVWLLVMEHCTGGDLFDVIKACSEFGDLLDQC